MDAPTRKAKLKENLDNFYAYRILPPNPGIGEFIFLTPDGRWGVSDEAAFFKTFEDAEAALKKAAPHPDGFNTYAIQKVSEFIRQYRPLLWDVLDA